MEIRRHNKRIFTILFPVAVFVLFGLFALYSISTHQDTVFLKSSFFKQLIFLSIGIIAMFAAFSIPISLYHKYIYWVYLFAIFGILTPYFLKSGGATNRWIHFGSIGVQPSEYAKWISILLLARYLTDAKQDMEKMKSFVIPILIIFIPALIVFNQPDLGTAMIMISPIIPVLYWVGARPYHLLLLIAPLLSVLTAFHSISFTIWAIVLAIVIILSKPKLWSGITVFFGNIFLGLLTPMLWNILRPYQQKRVLTLFNPDLDPLGAAYQIIQSKTAIGSGGFLGKGWIQGTQTHLKFLPVQETDFILSVIGEEFGFIAIVLILASYTYLIIKMLRLSYKVKDRFASIVILGIAIVLLSQIFVNAAMTVGLIPVKGLPLPFISYGGSFLLSSFIMVGIVLSFASRSAD